MCFRQFTLIQGTHAVFGGLIASQVPYPYHISQVYPKHIPSSMLGRCIFDACKRPLLELHVHTAQIFKMAGCRNRRSVHTYSPSTTQWLCTNYNIDMHSGCGHDTFLGSTGQYRTLASIEFPLIHHLRAWQRVFFRSWTPKLHATCGPVWQDGGQIFLYSVRAYSTHADYREMSGRHLAKLGTTQHGAPVYCTCWNGRIRPVLSNVLKSLTIWRKLHKMKGQFK